MKFVRLMGVTVVVATAVSPTTTRGGKVDDCYGSANLNCCDFASSNFRIPCQWSPTGYCLGTVYMNHNTITPIQVRPNPTGWTDGSFYVPSNQVYRCEYYTPICSILLPSGCSVSQSLALEYCVGLLPDEVNGIACDGV